MCKKLNEKFDLKELWEILKEEFPEFVVTDKQECVLSGYLTRTSSPTMRLEVTFEYSKEELTLSQLGSWIEVKIDAFPIGKYQSICAIIDKFISYLQLVNKLTVIPSKGTSEAGVIYTTLSPEKYFLPSLKGYFLDDWDSSLEIMRTWETSQDGI
ncbi:hypothetical protein FACS1894176_02430 [Bacteroidia bacterium]|nr:hypothetical protein FACS1894176_02430 [Bacteroidia bacterium]